MLKPTWHHVWSMDAQTGNCSDDENKRSIYCSVIVRNALANFVAISFCAVPFCVGL